MTVALVSTVWGQKYRDFVPRWWAMANALDPKPNEIVIAHHPDELSGFENLPVRLVSCEVKALPAMLNAAIEVCESEWIQQCPIDDRLSPDALDVYADAPADADLIVVGASAIRAGVVWMGDFASIWGSPEQYRMNHHCPIKRDLWMKVGGFGAEHWCDWGFFLRADKAGCKPHHVNKVTLTYDDTHTGRYSNLGGQAADDEIRQLQASLR